MAVTKERLNEIFNKITADQEAVRTGLGRDPDDKTAEKGRSRRKPADAENESRFRSIFQRNL